MVRSKIKVVSKSINPDFPGGFRLYQSSRAREIAIGKLKNLGFNYFVTFKDTNKKYPFGLDFAKIKGQNWVSRQ